MGTTRRLWAITVLGSVLVGCGGAGTQPQASPPGRGSAMPDPAAESRVDQVLVPALAGQEPRAAPDPQRLARQISVSVGAVRDPASTPEQVRAAGWTAQIAYRALEQRPEWDATVLAGVPAPLHDAVVRNTTARRELGAMSDELGDTLPPWRIVEPPPAGELRAIYGEAQRRFGVPWEVLAAVNLVETGTGRIVGLSVAGAQGPMQFMPATWARYGMAGDVWNTHDAIMGAANYLAANGAARGDLDNALYRYNNDPRYVRAVRHYAEVMRVDERAFLGYHAWPVYFRTRAGDILLPVGYESPRRIPVQEWLAGRPR
ncbi:MAG: lytic murein transglycosylase [Pseudonocardiaceae bacterium]